MKKTLILGAVFALVAFGSVAQATVSPDLASRNAELDRVLSSLVNKIVSLTAENTTLKAENASLRSQLGLTVARGTDPTVASAGPTEVSFESLASCSPVIRSTMASIYCSGIRVNDNFTFEIVGKGKTSELISQSTAAYNNFNLRNEIGSLVPNTEYSYTIKIERAGQISVKSGTFRTLAE